MAVMSYGHDPIDSSNRELCNNLGVMISWGPPKSKTPSILPGASSLLGNSIIEYKA